MSRGWRRACLAVALFSGLALGACGQDEPRGASDATRPATSTGATSSPAPGSRESERPCPAGTPELTARDVVRPGSGEVLVRGDERVDRYVRQWEAILKERIRSSDARILLPRGADAGTLVVVLNTTAVSDDSAIGPAAAEAERDFNEEREAVTIGGRPGSLGQARDGAFVATAPTGDCAMLVLVSDRKGLLAHAITRVSRSGAG